MTGDDAGLPPGTPEYVTFEDGARLLVELGIAPNITSDGVRYIARTRKDIWPFGDGRPYPYGRVANARTMRTRPFVEFFRKHPPGGRGPDRGPRRTPESK